MSSLEIALALLALGLPLGVAPMNLGAGLVLLALLRRGISRPQLRELAKRPELRALALYLAAGLAAALCGLDPGHSLRDVPKDLHKWALLSTLLLALRASPSPGAWRLLAASFSALALFGLWQVAVARHSGVWTRAHAFVHPVTFGAQAAFAVLGGLCFFGRAEAGLGSRRARLWTAAYLLLAAAALLLNQTRMAALGAVAGYAAACLAAPALRRLAAWTGGAALLAALTWELIPTGGRALSELFASFNPAGPAQLRLTLWRVAWEMFRGQPLTGVGQGQYRSAFSRYFPGALDGERGWGSAHNLFLHQLAERGLLGLLALLAALGTLGWLAWRRARREPNPWNLWSLGVMAAFLAMNLTENAFQNELVTSLVLFSWAWAEANSGRKSYN